ncbi:MAG TPA: extensin family protein [Polyangiaceae bacterium]|nr:extensin family protein [Polyangiaceae bacterium]
MTSGLLRAGFFAIAATAIAGCARSSLPPELPGMPGPASGAHEDVLTAYVHHGRHGVKSLSIPDGDDCLALLATDSIAFHQIAPRPGMITPVDVTGPIGGVRYETAGTTSLVCDCRLVVALDMLAPELRSFGIKEVQHSGAYVYRTTRRGHPSLHALGLAIDVHRIAMGKHRLDVSRDYARGQGPSCEEGSPVLNRLACELDRTGLFEQIITPDDDGDHRDHLHLAISPL